MKINKYRLARFRKKLLILQVYSKGKLKCSICGYDKNIDALSIDHIKNNGNKHRKKIDSKGTVFYNWLIRNNFPSGYQVLCMNCQFIKTLNSWK